MSGGGKGKKQVVGYKYFLGVHAALCHGPIDVFREFIIGERQAWTGSVTDNTTITVNKPELFGGEAREGGVVGNVDVMMGGPTQSRNTYLQKFQGANSPAYRGVVSLVFKSFQWSSGNPYFKAPWFRVSRILKGWSTGDAWNPTKAVINTYDMNPAHIIYQCLTDANWGMGYTIHDIDDDSFTAAALTLFNEGFGMSLMWSEQQTIEDFIGNILNHVNGSLGMDLATGKFVIRLVRDDYDVEALVGLDPSNIIALKSFQRGAHGDAANTVTVVYTDRDENEKSVTVQDLAAIQAQGGEVPMTRQYRSIREPSLAARVAERDLATLSSNLAKMSITCNRVLWAHEKGDVIKVTWPDLNITNAAFRIVEINKGQFQNGTIEVELVEDVFGLPAASYTITPPSAWTDTAAPPVAVEAARAIEAPYWEIVRSVPESDMNTFGPTYGFGSVIATRGFVNSPMNFRLAYSASSGGTYTEVGTGHFSPTGLLAADIGHTDTTFNLSDFYDLDQAPLDTGDNGYAVIDNEYVAVTAVDDGTGEVTVRRGVLDTVPAEHTEGTRMYFVTPAFGYDPTERVSGETAYYKPLPTTGLGTLPDGSATALPLTFANRASRPYPPGHFRINTLAYPEEIVREPLVFSWAHRDRLAQTVSLVDNTQGNFGPEVGTTYTLRLTDVGTSTVLYTYTGLTGTSQAIPAMTGVFTLRVELWSVRDGIDSLQKHEHTFNYINFVAPIGLIAIYKSPTAPTDLAATNV